MIAVLVAIIAVLSLTTLLVVLRGDGDDGDGLRAGGGGTVEEQAGLRLPKVPEGYDLFADQDGSFAFVVPDGWETILLEDESVRRARDRLEDDDPAIAGALDSVVRLVGDNGQAFAAEIGDADGFIANLNLLLAPRGSGTLQELAASGRLGLEKAGVQVGQPRTVTIGDRAGLVVELGIDGPNGRIDEQQLYLASGYRVYVLTVAGVDATTTQKIFESLRVP